MRILLFITIAALCSCSFIERRTYSRANDPSQAWQEYEYNKRGPLEQEAMRELDLTQKKSLSENERYQVGLRMRVNQLEDQLRSPTEIEQYYKHKPFMASDSKRIEFLSLSDIYQKQSWLEKNVQVPMDKYNPEVEKAIKTGNLVPNMTRDAVIKSWGSPETVEVSGNPAYGNERWSYPSFGSNNINDYEETKQLYFENGVLKGWKTVRKAL